MARNEVAMPVEMPETFSWSELAKQLENRKGADTMYPFNSHKGVTVEFEAKDRQTELDKAQAAYERLDPEIRKNVKILTCWRSKKSAVLKHQGTERSGIGRYNLYRNLLDSNDLIGVTEVIRAGKKPLSQWEDLEFVGLSLASSNGISGWHGRTILENEPWFISLKTAYYDAVKEVKRPPTFRISINGVTVKHTKKVIITVR